VQSSHFRIMTCAPPMQLDSVQAGVADEWLHNSSGGRAKVSEYSQMKLQMKREALEKMTAKPMRCRWILAQPRFSKVLAYSFGTVRPEKMTDSIRSKVEKCFKINGAIHCRA